jgi:hypothetical protein
MRARNIKPSIWENEFLSDCEPLARLLFIGLWAVADREGRLENRPRRLKHQILGYDDCDVDSMLDQLVAKGLITRYEVGGATYILVNGFSRHQRPHPNEAKSVLPAPPDSESASADASSPTGSKSGARGKARSTREKDGPNPSDPGIMNPESERGNAPKRAQTPQDSELDLIDRNAMATFKLSTGHGLPPEKLAEYRNLYSDVNLSQAFYELGQCLDAWMAGEQGRKKRQRADRYRRNGPHDEGFWSFVSKFVKPDSLRGGRAEFKDLGDDIAGEIPERLRA